MRKILPLILFASLALHAPVLGGQDTPSRPKPVPPTETLGVKLVLWSETQSPKPLNLQSSVRADSSAAQPQIIEVSPPAKPSIVQIPNSGNSDIAATENSEPAFPKK